LAFVYETAIDPGAENNSHAFTLDIVGYNKRVLEVGCATGYFTKALSDRGCQVVGIEYDAEAAALAEKWAERVVVGDLDAGNVWPELEGEQFDAVTFGDVLEHLRDPLATLRAAARVLKPSGIVVISVPNIAHGDVRIALLQGTFPYRETGLLDRTHIRFFTKTGLRDLIKEAGLVLVDMRRVMMPLFQTELEVKRDSVAESTISMILEDPEAETYQFVAKAVLDNGTRAVNTLADRVNELTDQLQEERAKADVLRKEAARQGRVLMQRDMELLRRELGANRQSLREAQHQAEHYRMQSEALLNTKVFRIVAPLRRLYGALRRTPKALPTSPEP